MPPLGTFIFHFFNHFFIFLLSSSLLPPRDADASKNTKVRIIFYSISLFTLLTFKQIQNNSRSGLTIYEEALHMDRRGQEEAEGLD